MASYILYRYRYIILYMYIYMTIYVYCICMYVCMYVCIYIYYNIYIYNNIYIIILYKSVKMAAPWGSLTLLSYYSLCPHLRSH